MSDSQTGTDVATSDEGRGLASIEPTPELVAQVRAAILDNEIPPEVGDPKVAQRAIKERILAGTLEDALEPSQTLPGWREYMDEPVMVLGFHLNPSNVANEDGEKGVYAVIELTLPETGEIVTVHCGGGNVLATLVNAWENHRYPFYAKLTERDGSVKGRSVLWLEKV